MIFRPTRPLEEIARSVQITYHIVSYLYTVSQYRREAHFNEGDLQTFTSLGGNCAQRSNYITHRLYFIRTVSSARAMGEQSDLRTLFKFIYGLHISLTCASILGTLYLCYQLHQTQNEFDDFKKSLSTKELEGRLDRKTETNAKEPANVAPNFTDSRIKGGAKGRVRRSEKSGENDKRSCEELARRFTELLQSVSQTQVSFALLNNESTDACKGSSFQMSVTKCTSV